MLRTINTALLSIAWLASATAMAGVGFKCVDTSGAIAFQDRPCAPDQQQSDFRYEASVPSPAPPSVVTEEPIAALPQVATTTVVPPRIAIAALYRCARGDGGKDYYSDSGVTSAYTVPLGVLGYPARNLGEVYGGRNGVGVSAPELARPSVLPASAVSAIAGASVWVQDQCRALPDAEACQVRRDQLDQLRGQLRHAFKDERARLEPRVQRLIAQLAGC